MSSRNNDFTNRSHKATIVLKAWKLALILGSAILLIALCCIRGAIVRRRLVSDPEHRLHSSARGRCIIRMGTRFDRWYHKSWFHKAPWSLSVVFVCIVLYGLGYWHAIYPKRGDPAPFYPHAKGCGRVLDVTCNLIFLPVLRNLISWLRTTPLRKVLPLGEEIYFHKLIGGLIAAPAIGHIFFHYVDYHWHAKMGTGLTITEQAFGSWTGISGHLILLFMVFIMTTGLEKIRRGRFKSRWFGTFSGHSLFVRVHKLWVVVLILLWTHSKAFWHYSLFPTVLLIVDKLIGRMRGKEPVQLVEAAMPAPDVMNLKLQLYTKRRLRYQAGQYLFLHCPQVSSTEWHPFTISSSPEERHFGVHIRCRRDMDWTHALRQLLLPDEKRSTVSPPQVMKVDVKGARGEGSAAEEGDAGGGWLSSIFGGGDETSPLQSTAQKLAHKSAKNVRAAAGGGKGIKKVGTNKSWKEGSLEERSEHPGSTARKGFLRRHLTKSIPKPERIPEPSGEGGRQGRAGKLRAQTQQGPSPPASPPDEEWEMEAEVEVEEDAEENVVEEMEEEAEGEGEEETEGGDDEQEEAEEKAEEEEDAKAEEDEAEAEQDASAALQRVLQDEEEEREEHMFSFSKQSLPFSMRGRTPPANSPPPSPPTSPAPSKLNPAGKARLAPGDFPDGCYAMEIGGKAVELYVDGE